MKRKSAKKLTKHEALDKHRIVWNKIAELLEESSKSHKGYLFITSYKELAMKEVGLLEDYPASNCYCCEYNNQYNKGEYSYSSRLLYHHCENCPIMWSKTKDDRCYSVGSLWKKLKKDLKNGEWKVAADLARQIANLPEREGV
jgi:hypothetical protein